MKIYQKMRLLMSGLCLVLALQTLAQNAKTDIIIKRDNSKIEAVVVEMDDQNIKYRKAENLSGPLYTISKGDVVSILYRNGEVESFATIPVQAQPVQPQSVQVRPQETWQAPLDGQR